MRALTLSCIVFLSCALAACSTSPVVKLYEGDDKPATQILTVRVPMELEIISINDRRIEGASTMFAYGHRDLQLLPGQYRIVAFYKSIYQINADEHEVIKSDPALFTLSGAAGDVYELKFNKPTDLEQARALGKKFDGWSENINTQERVASQPSGLILNQGFIGITSGAAVAATPSTTNVPPNAQTAESDTPSDAAQRPTSLSTLKDAWKGASPEDRREFLLWMSQ